MTSSLVGSEMCIRDRWCTTCLIPKHGCPPWTHYFRPIVLLSAFAKVPVSYTHLTLPTICSV
eukprot:11226074-Prorocentrum_lima.AAC.1